MLDKYLPYASRRQLDSPAGTTTIIIKLTSCSHCELDVYTSGIDERSNRTAMREVARVLAAVTDERIQPFLS